MRGHEWLSIRGGQGIKKEKGEGGLRTRGEEKGG